MKERLEGVGIPGEEAARDRTRAVLLPAFFERQPAAPRSHWPRVAAIAVALSALLAAALSPPGRAVLDEIRAVVGVKRAQPALFSLPAPGKLLVSSDAGVWIVQQDGARRLLGEYREASWSPFGRFVAAVRDNELAALEPDGDVRWTLARRQVRFPRWAGSATDTRIAYLATSRLRVVPGDGTGDVDLAGLPAAARIAPAWRPGARFVLAYVDTRGRVNAVDVGTGSDYWVSRPLISRRFPEVVKLEWSSDGGRLLLVTRSRIVVLGTRSAAPLAIRPLAGIVDAAFEPGSHRVAVARSDEVLLLDADRLAATPRRVFTGTGPFEGLAWSPNGRWLIVGWPAADQWVFVRGEGRSIRAVSGVSEQFRSRSFPRVEGWCCAR